MTTENRAKRIISKYVRQIVSRRTNREANASTSAATGSARSREDEDHE